MNIRDRWRKEKEIWPLVFKGYSRRMAKAWWEARRKDLEKYGKRYGADTVRKWHQQGYLYSSVRRYGLEMGVESDYITDFDYCLIQPFNNSFSKWIGDILTTSRVLHAHEEHFRKVYYSIVKRNGSQLILNANRVTEENSFEDLLQTVQNCGPLELRPSYWESQRTRYRLEYVDGSLHVNGKPIGEQAFRKTFDSLSANYVLAECVETKYTLSENLICDHVLKAWVANDAGEEPSILFATIRLFWGGEGDAPRRSETRPVDLESGEFTFGERTFVIPDWDGIKARLRAVSRDIKPISYYTVTIALQENAPFQFLRFSPKPWLPDFAFGPELNEYLKKRIQIQKASPKTPFSLRWKAFRNLVFEKFVRKFCRKGIRPYMQRLWLEAVRSDFLHTKQIPLRKKMWAWKRGFLSYRTYQYGLTPENYTSFLSDYDYYYLNRINNDYQKWINDKTTTRFILEPFKEHIPAYYFCFFNQNNEPKITKMQDCPESIEESYEGALNLLKERRILALKPSAGTHGDGFYCLSYENGVCLVNGEEYTEEQLIQLIRSFKSYYVLTEYVQMHSALKKIYAKSVNTVRMMVVNPNGYNPRIMQAYMRIGSSSTGYTDNVGYGGICSMVNIATGELYQPETIVDHKFYDCPIHPDSGNPISGRLPNWDYVCSQVLEISRYLSELEYLGYDIAITEDGFQLLEINIHQDLHKVALFTEEMKEFFFCKLSQKKKAYGVRE